MSIIKLLSKISAEIAWIKNQIDNMKYDYEYEAYNKLIIKADNSYKFLRKKILKLDKNLSLYERIQVIKDLYGLLKQFQNKIDDVEIRLTKINQSIKKLAVKYNIQDAKLQSKNESLGTNEEKNKISITYDLQKNRYYVNGIAYIIDPVRYRTMEQKEGYIRALLNKSTDFDKIFDKNNPKEVRALKYCDPYIIEILAGKDVMLARDYIKEMIGSKAKRSSKYNYNITYDVRGLNSIPEHVMTEKEKLEIKETIKHIRGVSAILEDRKKLPWYATIPVVGTLTISAISGGIVALGQGNIKNKCDSASSDSCVDSLDESSSELAENTYESSKTVLMDEYEQPEVKHKQDTEQNKLAQDEPIIINIGDKITVNEGVKYTEDCLGGGNRNKIGAVSWRPATEYSVDKVAFVYEGKILKIMNSGDKNIAETLNSVAKKHGINIEDINTSVLLSLIPGTGDTGWAQISVDEMERSLHNSGIKMQQDISRKADFDMER